MAANSMLRFSALALAAAGAAAQYVQYNTHQNNDCETVISSSVYMGVPTTEGVLAVDTCLAFEEGLTTFYDSEAANSVGTLSVQYVCNVTTGVLTNTWYSEADCGETDGFVTLDTVQDVCTTTCVEDEPDFGSDEFEDATVTFYEDADCATEVESEAFEVADLYELYGIDGTSCSVSGDFDLYTVLHCAESAPAAVYYEDDECAGDMVGITLNIGCTPVPSTAANGTYPGDYFMAECTEGVAAADDDTAVEEDDDEEEDTEATSGATSPSLVFGGLSGAFAAAVVVATSVAAFF